MRTIFVITALTIIGLVLICGCVNPYQPPSQPSGTALVPVQTHNTPGFTSCQSPESWIQIAFPQEGISRDTAEFTKIILLSRLEFLKARCGAVSFSPQNGTLVHSARVEFSGTDPETVKKGIGNPGTFALELESNASMYEQILTNEDISEVLYPQNESIPEGYFILIKLTDAGARKLQSALIHSGATTDPDHHNVSEIADGEVLFTGPLSPDSASREGKEVSITTLTMPGNSFERAVLVSVRLSKGPLPVDVKIENSGSLNN